MEGLIKYKDKTYFYKLNGEELSIKNNYDMLNISNEKYLCGSCYDYNKIIFYNNSGFKNVKNSFNCSTYFVSDYVCFNNDEVPVTAISIQSSSLDCIHDNGALLGLDYLQKNKSCAINSKISLLNDSKVYSVKYCGHVLNISLNVGSESSIAEYPSYNYIKYFSELSIETDFSNDYEFIFDILKKS